MRNRRFLLPLLLVFLVSACGQQEPAAVDDPVVEVAQIAASVSGTITYRERMALSPEAVAEIILQDVSRADAEAIVIAKQRITSPGQVPIRFKLDFDPADIDQRMTYSIQARITDHGRLMYINDTMTPVLTRGAGNEVEMTLVRVQGQPESASEDSASPAGMPLEGMFRYMADAAIFRDCRNNKTYPVSMEGAYIELERAYSNSGIEGGSEIMVRLQGRLLSRPAMEGNSNVIKLIVDNFNSIYPDKTCAPTTHAELVGTYWRLVEVNGQTVRTPEQQKEAHMVLAAEESAVRGNAGCNNFFGGFQTSDNALSFSQLGSTMMACPEGMDTERDFLAVLGSTTRFEISGLFLELYADDQLLARLEAIYF